MFKERQKNKDSPYNFNNPPLTTFDLEVYERTGQTKSILVSDHVHNSLLEPITDANPLKECVDNISDYAQQEVVNEQGYVELEEKSLLIPTLESVAQKSKNDLVNITILADNASTNSSHDKRFDSHKLHFEKDIEYSVKQKEVHTNDYSALSKETDKKCSRNISSNALKVTNLSPNLSDFYNQQLESLVCNQMGPPKKYQPTPIASTGSNVSECLIRINSSAASVSNISKYFAKHSRSAQNDITTQNSNPVTTSAGKRANRTRFTDYQIKVLQEFFENNSYPKDSDLEYLSKLLLLSPRVIVVWFQVSVIYCV